MPIAIVITEKKLHHNTSLHIHNVCACVRSHVLVCILRAFRYFPKAYLICIPKLEQKKNWTKNEYDGKKEKMNENKQKKTKKRKKVNDSEY